MPGNEYGPFQDERQALATRAAARIRAAFDAKPGVGASVPEALRVMTEACAECGVELGRMDLSTGDDMKREAAEALSRGDFAACWLGEDGNPVDPERED